MERRFNNRLNERIEANSKEYWISRSVAVVGIVFAIKDHTVYTLVTKRSSIMDQPHKLCVPCGYLDWYESCYEAMLREVYEETSLYLPDYKDNILDGYWNKIPFRIQDDPTKDARQNISFSYCTILDFDNCPEKFPHSIESHKTEEADEVRWVPVNLIPDNFNNIWAFNHNELINLALIYVGILK
jgi:8-oxo-dGTP pyrophosphatase MutT (NUDIX family)